MNAKQLIHFLEWSEELARENGAHDVADRIGIAAMLAAQGASAEDLADFLPESVARDILG